LRLSENGEPSAHKRVDDLGQGGLLLVKHHRRPIVRSLDIPDQLIGTNALLRLQDIPYPVSGIISPAGRGNVNLEEHSPVAGLGGCKRPCPEQQQSSKQKDPSKIAIFHVITPQVKDALN
jgi:hypothetical protein